MDRDDQPGADRHVAIGDPDPKRVGLEPDERAATDPGLGRQDDDRDRHRDGLADGDQHRPIHIEVQLRD